MKNPVHLYWKDPAAPARFKTGVSLHSHTNLSQESLDIVPRYTAKIPYLGMAVRAQQRRYEHIHGRPLDFARAFWTPPLSPRQAHEIEARQIINQGLKPLVSLTDHDNLQAGWNLSVLKPATPVSVEWTVPFGPTFFHLGVHNLARSTAHEIMSQLSAFTAKPDSLAPLLALLGEQPDTLLILNHPFWDECGIGEPEHAHTLGCFLERHGRMIHGLELNGLRPRAENARVVWLSRRIGLPVLSGGDRHGCEPNSLINLTNASTFSEFADEVRNGRESTVLFMPQHKEALRFRILQTMWDVMRDYPDHPADMRQWSDRVFFRDESGTPQPVRRFFQGGDEPRIVRQFSSLIRLVGSRGVRAVLRQALSDREEEATF